MEKKCKYCNSLYDEDLPKELICKKIKLYALEDKTLLDVSIDSDMCSLNVYLSSKDTIKMIARATINYCPMCGRKLT